MSGAVEGSLVFLCGPAEGALLRQTARACGPGANADTDIDRSRREHDRGVEYTFIQNTFIQ